MSFGYNYLTNSKYCGEYNIKITSYENNGLYKIQTYDQPIQDKLTEKQIKRRLAVRYRNEQAIELMPAFEINGQKYMHCLCVGKELERYNAYLDEKVPAAFIRAEITDQVEEQKQQKSIAISTSRSKKKIYEYAMSNNWDYFVTFTFNDDKLVADATDYEECTKRLSGYLSNLRKAFPDLAYLIVPEQHTKNKYYNGKVVKPNDADYDKGKYRWHFHGLFKGIDDSLLVQGVNMKTGQPIVKNGKPIYTIKNYHSGNYGYSTISRIENQKAVSNYICKYITKEMVELSKGKKRYWASKNLSLAKAVKKCDMSMKEAVCQYFKEHADYYKEQEICDDGYKQKICYMMTEEKDLAKKIRHFDLDEYTIIRKMGEKNYFQEIKSLNLRKNNSFMKEYIEGYPVKVLIGPFYNKVSGYGTREYTSPKGLLNVIEIDGVTYTYTRYDSPQHNPT